MATEELREESQFDSPQPLPDFQWQQLVQGQEDFALKVPKLWVRQPLVLLDPDLLRRVRQCWPNEPNLELAKWQK